MKDNEIMLQALTEYEEKYWASNDYKWQEQVNTLISKFRKKCIEERKGDIMKAGNWNNYIEYLKDWARQHEEEENEGMSPVCYDEFLDNESEE